MSPTLPSSLSPHVCVLPSPDLEQLLCTSSLPPLHDILQSFSPLPQVTTRTTTLVSVPHSSFALRFSSLVDVENACQEDAEKRAARTIDWISERINRRCAKWADDMEEKLDRDGLRSPWWDELQRCSEADYVPAMTEGWNHPVSIILAVSTTAANPLQAIIAMHSRILEFPSWVDLTHLVYTLVVHPQASALSDEEAAALFNAIRKQYGLHAYLLPLSLPSSPPAPVLVPPLPPRLPPPPIDAEQNGPQIPTMAASAHSIPNPKSNTIRMSEHDIQQTARFTREFVVMSLIPWMEKCVVEWNEAYSSSRRLPSRLFSSTRRLFGSGASTPQPPVHTPSTSTSSLPTRPLTFSPSQVSLPGHATILPPPSQQRRLAEFATMLGDYKLATSVWESLRKEGKGGSDILPILLSPSPAVSLHVTQALSNIHPSAVELPPQSQLQALKYAVRWEAGIPPKSFLSDVLEGERWLVWAAGNAEEPPSALLLAHAALLSVRKLTRRRAALWYYIAAIKLQKYGIKPLAMYFLRRAHGILSTQPEKSLSPSFWDSEGRTPSQHMGFDAAISGIEHPLGRLLYTTGDTWGAIRVFLDLLRWSSASSPSLSRGSREIGDGQDTLNFDKVYLEDFATALSHLQSISDEEVDLSKLTLPIKFAIPASCRVRLLRDSVSGEESEWEDKEEIWRSFWKSRGTETLKNGGKAAVGENFWVDVTLLNPLDAEVTLTNLTLVVEAKGYDALWVAKNVIVERIDEIVLSAKESRVVSVAVSAYETTTLTVSHLRYNFLRLLPTREFLARRGRRLQDTLQQRLTPTYAPDVLIKVDVEDSNLELSVVFEMEDILVVLDGEYKRIKVWMSNAGSKPIGEIWLLADRDDQISLDIPTELSSDDPRDILRTDNKLAQWVPHRVPLKRELQPAESTDVFLTWRPVHRMDSRFCTLFIYRETGGGDFGCTRVSRSYKVNPSLTVSARPCAAPSGPHLFLVNVEISNLAPSSLEITQMTTVSPVWWCQFFNPLQLGPLQQNQSASFLLGASPLEDRSCIDKTMAFVSRTLGDVLNGRKTEPESPPPLNLTCNHAFEKKGCVPLLAPGVSHLYQAERRNTVASAIAHSHPHIPVSSHLHVFPSYNPLSLDILAFWEIPSEKRSGFTLLSLTLGISHGALQDVIHGAEHAKVQRSMYAETRREKVEILQAVRDSEWNAASNPVVVSVQDGLVVEHDFDKGACLFPVTFTLRNCSLAHPSRYVLRFDPSQAREAVAGVPTLLPARYVGPLVIRGMLQPCESASNQMRLWAARPGMYALVGWKVEVDVGERCSGERDTSWRTRCHYTQGPPADQFPYCTVNSLSIKHA